MSEVWSFIFERTSTHALKRARDPSVAPSTDHQKAKESETNQVKQVPTSMFFAHNTALGPPYHVLIDTNFINFSIKVCMGFFWGGVVCVCVCRLCISLS